MADRAEGEVKAYRIIKAHEFDFHVERKGWFGWYCMHSTPGFSTYEAAERYIRRLHNPEVLAEFNERGEKL